MISTVTVPEVLNKSFQVKDHYTYSPVITNIDIYMDFTENVGKTVTSDKQHLAELKKERGNQLYLLKEYQQAIALYTEAIQLYPDSAAYYGNRSACYMMLYNYDLALRDAKKAVTLDRSFAKGYIRIAKCSLALGDMKSANNALSAVRKLSLINSSIVPEFQKLDALIKCDTESKKAYIERNFKKVVLNLNKILEEVPCARYRLQKAAFLAFSGEHKEAQNIASDILHTDKRNVDAIYLRGMCLYSQGNMRQAFDHFKYVLHLEPKCRGAINNYKRAKSFIQRMEEGSTTFNQGRYSEAYTIYTEALKIDPANNLMNTKLFFNRGKVCQRLGRLTEAVSDCSSALEIHKNYPKALLVRAGCYMDLGNFDKAVKDYKTAYENDKSPEIRRLLEDAELALTKPNHKNYYRYLDIQRTASPDEIKKAYKRKALIHHPDRHVNATESKRREQEVTFKEVGEAFAVLSSPAKRARYDNLCIQMASNQDGAYRDFT
jgi:DnaJ family protein C protein 7